MSKLYNIEIKRVCNGYIVMPPVNVVGMMIGGDSINVFETFEALVKYLDEVIGPKSDRPENG